MKHTSAMVQKPIGNMFVRLFGLLATLGIHRAPFFEQMFQPLLCGL
jgi:hypothetical protein